MKTKLVALLALLITAGICSSQTVTITTGGTITGTTFTNTVAGQPAVIVSTTQGVVFQSCTFNSPGDGIDSGVDGTQISIIGCTATGTATDGQTQGVFLSLHNPNGLLFNVSTITKWAAPVNIQGTTVAITDNISFTGNTFQNNAGPMIFAGLDADPNLLVQIMGNAFSGVTTPGNLVYIQNTGTSVAGFVIAQGNTCSNSPPFKGYVVECQGKFFETNFQSGTGAKCFYTGTVYSGPGNAGHN